MVRFEPDAGYAAGLPAVDAPADAVGGWAAATAEGFLDEGTPAEREAVADVLRQVHAAQRPDASASAVVRDPLTGLISIARFVLYEGPMSPQDQSVVLEPPGALAQSRPFETEALGRGIAVSVLSPTPDGEQTASALWVFSVQDCTLLGVLGPVPARALGALLPLVDELLRTTVVENEDGSLPLARGTSVLPPLEREDDEWTR